jgi:predicted dehydrogenase
VSIARIGFVGVGSISGIYLKNITGRFKELEVIGVCDLVREKAEKAVKEYGVPKLYDDMHALFADPEVDIVLNITRPAEHFEVTKAALEAGKHVYCEKPLGITFEEGKALVELAAQKGLTLCNAPDTFLGAGIQGSRRFIEEDLIGVPVGAAAHMICRGHETWHPDPEFYYKRGGGPMMDMGPYYITALVNLLGPVASVMGMTKTTFPTRTITSKALNGTVITVETPTYIAGLLKFASGAVATIFTTFDAYSMPGVQPIEIYGAKGNLLVPDPNDFGGEIKLKVGEANFPHPEELLGHGNWIPIESPYSHYGDNSRGLGLAEMAKALEKGTVPRTNAMQALHVLEVLTAFEKSSDAGKEIAITTSFAVQPPMPIVAEEGLLD